VIFVAKSGGDFTSIQDAIDSAIDPVEKNPYLVWVGPGMYEEKVALVPHVHLQGAGQDATIIIAKAGNDELPISDATLVLTSNTSVRDLTAVTIGDYERNVAVLARDGVSGMVLSRVTAEAYGSANINYAIYARDSGTAISYENVSATARNCSSLCYGLVNSWGASAVLRGGTFAARDTGQDGAAYAINSSGSGSTIEAQGVIALAEEGGYATDAFSNDSGSAATLIGGFFSARGNPATGIYNSGSNTRLEATGVTVIAEDLEGTDSARGLYNRSSAHAIVRGGSFTAIGENAYGIYLYDGSTLVATGTEAAAEGCTDTCRGLSLGSSADALLVGGSFTAAGMGDAIGIRNFQGTLEAIGIRAAGLDGSSQVGLYNSSAVSLLSQSQLVGADASISAGVTVTVTNSSLVGGPASSSVHCLLVVRGGNVSADTPPYTCP
jgi:hypothetical protein